MVTALEQALDAARVRRRLPTPAARRHLRNSAGISQAAIAEAVGVSREAVSLWESGLRTPSPEHAERYLEVLDQLATELRK